MELLRRKPHRFRIMGLDPSPELLAISMVYFVQGILGLSRLALSFFFKDDLHIEPAQVAVLTGLASLPWMIKPLYGFISDAIPLFGYRRRSYLVLCGLLGTGAWTALAVGVTTASGAVVAMVLGSLSTAFSDVVVDSIVVQRARGEPQSTSGSLQSLCWAASAVGGILSAYYSGSLVEDYGVRTVFGITAVFPLIVSLSALLIVESPVGATAAGRGSGGGGSGGRQHYEALATTDGEGAPPLAVARRRSAGGLSAAPLLTQLRGRAASLWVAFGSRNILLPTFFLFIWQATPTAESAMFYYYTNELHFGPEFLGHVRLAGSIASLIGIGVYNLFLKKVPLRRMLTWAMVLGTALGSTQLLLVSGVSRRWGISDEWFVLGDSVILTVLGQVSFMPILVLAARLCPEGVEATLFATLMSIFNAGGFVAGASGAALTAAFGVTSTKFAGLLPLLAVCNFSALLPAPFLGLLPPELDEDKEDGEEGGPPPTSTRGGPAQQPPRASDGGGGGRDAGRDGVQQAIQMTEADSLAVGRSLHDRRSPSLELRGRRDSRD